MKSPVNKLSSEDAIALLKAGTSIKNFHIVGETKIETLENWDKEVFIENCFIEYLSASVTHFINPVTITNCHFKKCQFIFTYFIGGLVIKNCVFDERLDFQAGGHNKVGNQILIANNLFKGFVNFFDCWYQGEVIIQNNTFVKGTNIQANNQLITFDKIPTIENNLGELKIEAEDV